jgi:hypothetical protein
VTPAVLAERGEDVTDATSSCSVVVPVRDEFAIGASGDTAVLKSVTVASEDNAVPEFATLPLPSAERM